MKRLEYIDALRGFTILLVVYFHVCLTVENSSETSSSIMRICARFRMPLFFCISGFFAYGIYDGALLRKRIKNRLTQQLWPTVWTFLIYIHLCGTGGVSESIFHPLKAGYWFTYSLFQVFLPFSIITYLMTRNCFSKRTQAVIYSAIMIICFISASVLRRLPGNIIDSRLAGFLSLDRTVMLSTFFYFGAFIRVYFNYLTKLFECLWFNLAVFCIFVIMLFFNDSFITRLSGYFGIILTVGVFYCTKAFWSNEHSASRGLQLLGKTTLPIYLFHTFILYVFALSGMQTFIYPYIGITWIEFPVVMLISCIVAFICVIIDKGLSHVKPLYKFLFGK